MLAHLSGETSLRIQAAYKLRRGYQSPRASQRILTDDYCILTRNETSKSYATFRMRTSNCKYIICAAYLFMQEGFASAVVGFHKGTVARTYYPLIAELLYSSGAAHSPTLIPSACHYSTPPFSYACAGMAGYPCT